MKHSFNRFVCSLIIFTSIPSTLCAQSDEKLATLSSGTIFVECNDQSLVIDLGLTVDGRQQAEAWNRAIEDLFKFADVNSNDRIDANEVRLVPSGRAVSMVLGSGFVPPIAQIEHLEQITGDRDSICDRQAFRSYYKRCGVTGVQAGLGRMPQSAALTAALIKILDSDGDGVFSQSEPEAPEAAIQRSDANDDGLIGAGELLPAFTYPGCSASDPIAEDQSRSYQGSDKRPLLIGRCSAMSAGDIEADERIKRVFELTETAPAEQSMRPVGSLLTVCVWRADGSLSMIEKNWGPAGFFSERARRGGQADSPEPKKDRQPWFVSIVDRNGDGQASDDEQQAWLDVQRSLHRSQALISIYVGGGLFEILDSNHDAALSLRELRTAWSSLSASGYRTGKGLRAEEVPQVVCVVVSHGYATSLAVPNPSKIDWFEAMDRNRDGDISRREFTGSSDAFKRVDSDQDGLISPLEAEKAN